LMLDTEQDYARFRIKPEEDDFVVKDRPASEIVVKAAAKSGKALGDPKASFLAWFRALQQDSGVRYELPASLGIALEGLSDESFAVAVPPLRCKLRTREELPRMCGSGERRIAGLRRRRGRVRAAAAAERGGRCPAGPEFAGRGSAR